MTIDYSSQELRDKRVAIAKDVLARLEPDAEIGYAIEPARGYYFAGLPSTFVRGKPLTEYFAEVLPHCTVCLIAAAVVSKASMWPLDDRPVSPNGFLENSRYRLFHALKDVFSERQLDLMEIAFEGHTEVGNEFHGGAEARAASKFSYGMDSPRQIMAAIFQNVVNNDGSFKP
jgi:hypothetical protein